MGTRSISATANAGFAFEGGGTTLEKQEAYQESRLLEKVFPADLSGYVLVQNKTTSSAGRGWKIEGPAQIVNPGQPRLLIEGGGGEPITYLLADTIETVVDVANLGILRDAELAHWPRLTLAVQNGRMLSARCRSSRVPVEIGIFSNYTATLLTQLKAVLAARLRK